ncbi:MAG: ABC transporter permease [Kordiimonadaceae bacterium]|nr:ABC transporter permease [Kordiimonadaceae bacterium]
MAIGLACYGLIFLFVTDELSYDSSLPDASRIYRLDVTYQGGATEQKLSTAPFGAADVLSSNFKAVEDVIRIGYIDPETLFVVGDERDHELVWRADSGVFKFFSIELINGGAGNQALTNESSIVISDRIAQKYFGDQPALGRVVTLKMRETNRKRKSKDYKVSGVFKALPANSNLNFDIVIRAGTDSLPTFVKDWGYQYTFTTFLKLHASSVVADLTMAFPSIVDTYVEPSSPDIQASEEVELSLENIRDIHLSGVSARYFKPLGNPVDLYVLSSVAILILVIAAINFTNLLISKSLLRTKEVAVRKVLGAHQFQIMWQFIGENAALVLISIILAFGLIEISLPLFSDFVGKGYSLAVVNGGTLFVSIIILSLGIGVLAGCYPAFISSLVRPSRVLGASGTRGANIQGFKWIQGPLITFQFGVAVALIVASTVVLDQIKYSENADLGYVVENKLLVPHFLRDGNRRKQSVIQTKLRNIPGVTGVTFSAVSFGTGGDWMSFGSIDPIDNPRDTSMNFSAIVVDSDFFDVYKLQFESGRPFSPEYSGDNFTFDKERPFAVVLNKTAVRALGWANSQDSVGKRLKLQGKYDATIIGVVSDHHLFSLEHEIAPLMYVWIKTWAASVATIQYDHSVDPSSVIAATQSIWEQYHPLRPMDYRFLKDDIAAQYDSDRKQGIILTLFSMLAIVIAGLGLFGLVSFSVNRRAQEISMRKIYGANSFDVVSSFLWRFTLPVLLGSLIAWPVMFYFMSDYLAGFSYHMDLGASHFVIASLIVLGATWLAVLSQTFRIIRMRPIEVLRET